MKPSLVYSRGIEAHCIVRIIPANRFDMIWDSREDLSKELNALLTVKNLSGLLKTIGDMPPVLPLAVACSRRRVFTVEQAMRDLPGDLIECNEGSLRAESFIESCRPMRANGVSARRAVSEYGSTGALIAEGLEEDPADSENLVVVEPLQDWMTLVNSLKLCARLLAAINSREQVSLEDLGFAHMTSKRLKGKELYGLPFKFNTLFSGPDLVEGWQRQDPLFYALTHKKKVGSNAPSVSVPVYALGEGSSSIFVTTRPIAAGDQHAAGSNKHDIDGKALYLCIEDNGDQRKMASNVVLMFGKAFRNLSVPQDGATGGDSPCGWEYDADGGLRGLDAPLIRMLSFASALWYQLVYHPGQRLSRCKWCGDAMMSKDIGPKKEFCTGSCRVQYGRKYPQNG